MYKSYKINLNINIIVKKLNLVAYTKVYKINIEEILSMNKKSLVICRVT